MKLEAREITKKFGEQTALDHVDLTIENGEFFGLLGTNGAGKTTMIRILSTLMLPTSGKVYADGQELKRSHVEMKEPDNGFESMTIRMFDVSGESVCEDIRKLDINTLTPIEAMNLIYNWKKQLM